ncbi:TPA: hypothetical protein HA251_00285 [Candidatus Woesearchaeota archaeon]|nr:hypothetical protein [Candidatus Woesearchaeota archaeon]
MDIESDLEHIIKQRQKTAEERWIRGKAADVCEQLGTDKYQTWREAKYQEPKLKTIPCDCIPEDAYEQINEYITGPLRILGQTRRYIGENPNFDHYVEQECRSEHIFIFNAGKLVYHDGNRGLKVYKPGRWEATLEDAYKKADEKESQARKKKFDAEELARKRRTQRERKNWE